MEIRKYTYQEIGADLIALDVMNRTRSLTPGSTGAGGADEERIDRTIFRRT
ncbi:hypothetical protein J9317_03135 [Metabacillus sp. KIGAM252]|uniref:Uncharacterized protein n=1 Tax=Metabacillus flavus TaxID=2823519 RepID=A0ABS5LAV4_9BACI|nr:hypothetical protein [Metabacillus flavus]MBS2967769.1 hypothetical protein [Metabacillus flavus]